MEKKISDYRKLKVEAEEHDGKHRTRQVLEILDDNMARHPALLKQFEQEINEKQPLINASEKKFPPSKHDDRILAKDVDDYNSLLRGARAAIATLPRCQSLLSELADLDDAKLGNWTVSSIARSWLPRFGECAGGIRILQELPEKLAAQEKFILERLARRAGVVSLDRKEFAPDLPPKTPTEELPVWDPRRT